MSIVSKAQLKADFLDGKIITEDKMDDLIDSTYNPNLVAGTDITLVPSGNDITINSTGGGGALSIEDEGVLIDAATVLIDFVGVGVTATSTGAGSVEVNIPGGGVINTIYTADDAILAVRDVTLPALQNLTFTSPASGNAVLLVGDQIAGGGGIFALGDNAAPANGTSVTIGKDSSTGGDSSIAIGDQAQAGMGGNNTIAIGFSASTGIPNGENAIAIGNTAQVNMTSGDSAIAIGSNSSADNGSSIAIGQTAQSHADSVIAIGPSAEGGAGGGDGGIAIGDSSQVNSNAGDSAIAIGNSAVADEANCIAVGTGAAAGRGAGGENSIAIGESSQANQTNGDYGIAIGTTAQADASESIGIGVGAVAAAQGNISIGNNAGAAQTATETLTVLIGNTAGQTLSGGSNSNTVVGSGAFSAATVSSENTIIGASAAFALAAALPATGNTVVGSAALALAEGGSGNVAIGSTALGQIGQFASNPTYNTGVGTGAGFYLGLGSDWNVSIGNQAGPSDTAATPRPQEGTIAIGAFAGDGVTTGGNNLVDNSIYIGNRTTMAATDINTLSAFAIGGGRDVGNHSKLLMYGRFEDVVDGGTTDARLKINPGTGQDNVFAGGTAVLPDATLQIVNDGSGTTDAFKIDRGPSGTGVEGAIFNVDNTGAVTIGDQDAGTEYTLPIADGAAGEALVTDGAGNVGFRQFIFTQAGVMINKDAGTSPDFLDWGAAFSPVNDSRPALPIGVNCKITQVVMKWGGDLNEPFEGSINPPDPADIDYQISIEKLTNPADNVESGARTVLASNIFSLTTADNATWPFKDSGAIAASLLAGDVLIITGTTVAGSIISNNIESTFNVYFETTP